MPTGYTAAVCDGKMTDFNDFALSCARAFGALVTMRDEPSDTPVPDIIKPSSYNTEQLIQAKARLRELQAFTPPQAEIAALKAYEEASAYAISRNAEYAAENERIDSMLTKVRDWPPPTKDHDGMKAFMIEQLTISRSTYRVEPPTRLQGPAWLAAELAGCNRNIEYNTREQIEENARAAGRTKWLRDLRASLATS